MRFNCQIVHSPLFNGTEAGEAIEQGQRHSNPIQANSDNPFEQLQL